MFYLSYLAVISFNVIRCSCTAEYEIFTGFEDFSVQNFSLPPVTARVSEKIRTSSIQTNTERITTSPQTTSSVAIDVPLKSLPPIKLKHRTFNERCPETEHPISIGSYEIPTARDLVLFTKRVLVKSFNSYNAKTLLLLKDIKEATKATVTVEKKCPSMYKLAYNKCVKDISKKSTTIAKELVNLLDRKRQAVSALTQGKICNLTAMKSDPLELIKQLAMNEAALEFALPGFLRLLGSCSFQCENNLYDDNSMKIQRHPTRHMTDQDLVVKHFLTRKNYIELIKNSK